MRAGGFRRRGLGGGRCDEIYGIIVLLFGGRYGEASGEGELDVLSSWAACRMGEEGERRSSSGRVEILISGWWGPTASVKARAFGQGAKERLYPWG